MKLITRVVIGLMFVLMLASFGQAQNNATQKERRSLLKVIVEKESLEDQLADYGGFNKIADEMNVKKINQTNKTALFVIDSVMGTYYCGSTGNCMIWVFQESDSDYELLLKDYGIAPLKTSTSGYRDFRTADGSIAAQGTEKGVIAYQTIYKWNGSEYTPHCFKVKRVGKRTKSIPTRCG